MTVEHTLASCLLAVPALSGMKVRGEIAKAGDVAPYIVYTQFSGSRPSCLSGDSGLGNPRFQIDVYAPTRDEASTLKKVIRDAILASATLQAVFLSDRSGYEPDTKLYRQRQDFSIWFQD